VIIPLWCNLLQLSNELILNWSYIAMGFKKRVSKHVAVRTPRTLADLPTGQRCIIDRLDLPEDIARRLMELGFLPGNEVVPGRRAPGGGPRVFRVDGSEVALRDDTAARLYLRRDPESDFVVLP
jgi:ferrous iron transport protein A